MSDLATRLVTSIAFIPIWIAVSCCVGIANFDLWRSIEFWGIFAASLATMLVGHLLWKAYLRGRSRRVFSSTPVAGAVLVHLMVWMPLWRSASCYVEDMLRLGQSIGMMGIWGAVTPYIWWGGGWFWLKASSMASGGRKMTDQGMRILMSISLLPLTFGIFLILAMAEDDLLNTEVPDLAIALPIAAVFFVLAWLGIWRASIPESRTRRRLTVLLGIGAIGAVTISLLTEWEEFAALLIFGAWSVWIAGTAWLWRDASVEAAAVEAIEDRLRCPDCDYRLVGLTEARCPECGRQWRIEDLFARLVGPDV
jgi:hypothetical protein